MKPRKEQQRDISVTFQPVKSGKINLSLIAYVHYNQWTRTILREKYEPFLKYDEKHDDWRIEPTFEDVHETRYRPARVSTGICFPKIYWNKKNKKATGPYSYINQQLADFAGYVKEMYYSMLKSGLNPKDIDEKNFADLIKKHISNKFKEVNPDTKTYTSNKNKQQVITRKSNIVIPGYFGNDVNGIPTRLSNYIDYKISEYESQGPYLSGKSPATLKNYRRFLNQVRNYTSETKRDLDLLSISTQDCKDFLGYFINKGKYKFNYIEGIKRDLRSFIEKCNAEDCVPYSPSLNMKDKFFRLRFEKEDDPYLTFAHLDKIRAVKFGTKPKNEIELVNKGRLKFVEEGTLDLIRDMFIINCACGLRFSDFRNLKHIYRNKDDWFFSVTNEKTDAKVKIPVKDPTVISLYQKKYNGEFNFNITEQCYNRGIKVVCFRAKLTEPFEKSTKDVATGKLHKEHPPLYTLITSKTARKTFASNAVREYLMPLTIVSSWTGHKLESSLRHYIQLTSEDNYEISVRMANLMVGIR